jgi:hypothetical protein
MKKNRHDRRADAAKFLKTPDPLKIYMNAERFRLADTLLRQNPDPQVAVTIATPALVLSAFASELYLKCLIALESGHAAHGHDLAELFKDLTRQTQNNLEKSWTRYVSDPLRQRHYAAIAALVGYQIPNDLRWTLKNCGSGFIDLRYIHEGDGTSKFLLGDFPHLLRREVLLHRPMWEMMTHSPMKPVPGFETPIDQNN